MADEIVIAVRAEDNFSGVLGNFGNILTGIKSAIDLVGDGFRIFADFAGQGLDAIASYERLEASLQTLTASQILQAGAAETMNEALAMASPLAEELVQWNQELAINSPFTSEGVAQAFRMAMAYGFTTDEAKRLTEAMIDFAAGSGATEASMQAIARALGQISATGKVTGGDMLQLVNAGLPVVEILAEGFGVSTAKLMEMREKGLLPATEAIEYITQYLETNFAGAAERQANTWAGLKGTFQDITQIGLREFFGGIFEALQPVAVSLSEWLQSEAMEKLRFLGDTLGSITSILLELAGISNAGKAFYDLGAALAGMEDVPDFVRHLGLAFMDIQNSIDMNLNNIEVLPEIIRAFDGFFSSLFQSMTNSVNNWIDNGGPEEITNKVISWIEGIGTQDNLIRAKGSFVVLLNTLIDALGEIDWSGIADAMDEKLAHIIERHDWEQSGASFGQMIEDQFTAWLEGDTISPESDAVSTLGSAISEFFLAAMNQPDWSTAGQTFIAILKQFVFEPVGQWVKDNWITIILPAIPTDAAREKMRVLAQEMIDGLVDGIREAITPADLGIREWLLENFSFDPGAVGIDIGQAVANGLNAGLEFLLDVDQWVRDHIIAPVMRVLGISSPSTVFFDIGRNIVLGLISGFTSMIGSWITIVSGIVNSILNIFQPVLDVLGINISGGTGGATGDATGLVGSGGSTGSGAPGTPAGSGSVVNNYYGPVYFQGGSEPGSYYDCPSPNPLLTASQGGLVMPSIG